MAPLRWAVVLFILRLGAPNVWHTTHVHPTAPTRNLFSNLAVEVYPTARVAVGTLFLAAEAADTPITAPTTLSSTDIAGKLTIDGLVGSNLATVGPSVTMTGLDLTASSGGEVTVTNSMINGNVNFATCTGTTIRFIETSVTGVFQAGSGLTATDCTIIFDGVVLSNPSSAFNLAWTMIGVSLTWKSMDLHQNKLQFGSGQASPSGRTVFLLEDTTWSMGDSQSQMMNFAGVASAVDFIWRRSVTTWIRTVALATSKWGIHVTTSATAPRLFFVNSTLTFRNLQNFVFLSVPGGPPAVHLEMNNSRIEMDIPNPAAGSLDVKLFMGPSTASKLVMVDSSMSVVVPTTGATSTPTVYVWNFHQGTAAVFMRNSSLLIDVDTSPSPTIKCLPRLAARAGVGDGVFTIESSSIQIVKPTTALQTLDLLLLEQPGDRPMHVTIRSSTIFAKAGQNLNVLSMPTDAVGATPMVINISSTTVDLEASINTVSDTGLLQLASATVLPSVGPGSGSDESASDSASPVWSLTIDGLIVDMKEMSLASVSPFHCIHFSDTTGPVAWAEVSISNVTVNAHNSVAALGVAQSFGIPHRSLIDDVKVNLVAAPSPAATLSILAMPPFPALPHVQSMIIRHVNISGPWTPAAAALSAEMYYKVLELSDSYLSNMHPLYNHRIDADGSLTVRNVSNMHSLGYINGHNVKDVVAQRVQVSFTDVLMSSFEMENSEESTLTIAQVTVTTTFALNAVASGTHRSITIQMIDTRVPAAIVQLGEIVAPTVGGPSSVSIVRGEYNAVRAMESIMDAGASISIAGALFGGTNPSAFRFAKTATLATIHVSNCTMTGTGEVDLLRFQDTVQVTTVLVTTTTATLPAIARLRFLQFEDVTTVQNVTVGDTHISAVATNQFSTFHFTTATEQQRFTSIVFARSTYNVNTTGSASVNFFNYAPNARADIQRLVFDDCSLAFNSAGTLSFVHLPQSTEWDRGLRQVELNGTDLTLTAGLSSAGINCLRADIHPDGAITKFVRISNSRVFITGGTTAPLYFMVFTSPSMAEVSTIDSNVTTIANAGYYYWVDKTVNIGMVSFVRSKFLHTSSGPLSLAFGGGGAVAYDDTVTTHLFEDSSFDFTTQGQLNFWSKDGSLNTKFHDFVIRRCTFTFDWTTKGIFFYVPTGSGYGLGRVSIEETSIAIQAQHQITVLGVSFATPANVPGPHSLTVRNSTLTIVQTVADYSYIFMIFRPTSDLILLDNFRMHVRNAGQLDVMRHAVNMLSTKQNVTVQNSNWDIETTGPHQLSVFGRPAAFTALEVVTYFAFINNDIRLKTTAQPGDFLSRLGDTKLQIQTLNMTRNRFTVEIQHTVQFLSFDMNSGSTNGLVELLMADNEITFDTNGPLDTQTRLFQLQFLNDAALATGMPRRFHSQRDTMLFDVDVDGANSRMFQFHANDPISAILFEDSALTFQGIGGYQLTELMFCRDFLSESSSSKAIESFTWRRTNITVTSNVNNEFTLHPAKGGSCPTTSLIIEDSRFVITGGLLSLFEPSMISTGSITATRSVITVTSTGGIGSDTIALFRPHQLGIGATITLTDCTVTVSATDRSMVLFTEHIGYFPRIYVLRSTISLSTANVVKLVETGGSDFAGDLNTVHFEDTTVSVTGGDKIVFNCPAAFFEMFNLTDVRFLTAHPSYLSVSSAKVKNLHVGFTPPTPYTWQINGGFSVETLGLGPSGSTLTYVVSMFLMSKDFRIVGQISGSVQMINTRVMGSFINYGVISDGSLSVSQSELLQCQHFGRIERSSVVISWVRAACDNAATIPTSDRPAIAFGAVSGNSTVLIEHSEVTAEAAAGQASGCTFEEASTMESIVINNITLNVSGQTEATGIGFMADLVHVRDVNITDCNLIVRCAVGDANAVYFKRITGPPALMTRVFIDGGECDVLASDGPAICAAFDEATNVELFSVAHGTRTVVSPKLYAVGIGCANDGGTAAVRNIIVQNETVFANGVNQGSGAVMFRSDMTSVESILVEDSVLTATTAAVSGQAYALYFNKEVLGGADSSLVARRLKINVSNTAGDCTAVVVMNAKIDKITVAFVDVTASVFAPFSASSVMSVLGGSDAQLAINFWNSTVLLAAPTSMKEASVMHVIGNGIMESVSIENVTVLRDATDIPATKIVAPRLQLQKLNKDLTIQQSVLFASQIDIGTIDGATTFSDTVWSDFANVTVKTKTLTLMSLMTLNQTSAMKVDVTTTGGEIKIQDVHCISNTSLVFFVGSAPVSITNVTFHTQTVRMIFFSAFGTPAAVSIDNITVLPAAPQVDAFMMAGVLPPGQCPVGTCNPVAVSVKNWIVGDVSLTPTTQLGSVRVIVGGEFSAVAVSDVIVKYGGVQVHVGQFENSTPLNASIRPSSVSIARVAVLNGSLGVSSHKDANVTGCVAIVDSYVARMEHASNDFTAIFVNSLAADSLLLRGNKITSEFNKGAGILVMTRSIRSAVIEDNVANAAYFRDQGLAMSIQITGAQGIAHVRRNNLTCLGLKSCTALHLRITGLDLAATNDRGAINGPTRLYAHANVGHAQATSVGGIVVATMAEFGHIDAVEFSRNEMTAVSPLATAAAGIHISEFKKVGIAALIDNTLTATCHNVARGFSIENITASRVSIAENHATVTAGPLGHSGIVLSHMIEQLSQLSIMRNRVNVTPIDGVTPPVVSFIEGGFVELEPGVPGLALTITDGSSVFVHMNDLQTSFTGPAQIISAASSSLLIDGSAASRLSIGCNTINRAAPSGQWNGTTHTSGTSSKIATLAGPCTASACLGTGQDWCPTGPGSGDTAPTFNSTDCSCTCAESSAFPASTSSLPWGRLNDQCVAPFVKSQAVVRPEICSGFTVLNPPEAAGLRAKVTGSFAEQARIYFSADREMFVSVAPGATVQLDVMAVDGFGRPLSATHAPLLAAHLSVSPAATAIAESGTSGVIRVTLTAATPSQRFLISAKMDAVSPRVYLPGGGYVSLRTGLPCSSLTVDLPPSFDFAVPTELTVTCLDSRSAIADWMMTHRANTTVTITGNGGETFAVWKPMMASKAAFMILHPPSRIAARIDGTVNVAVTVQTNGTRTYSSDVLLCGNSNGITRPASLVTSTPILNTTDPVVMFTTIGGGDAVNCSVGGAAVAATQSGCSSMCNMSGAVPPAFVSGALTLSTGPVSVNAGTMISGSLTAVVARMPFPQTRVPLARTGALGTWRVQVFPTSQATSPATATALRLGSFMRLNVTVGGAQLSGSEVVTVAASRTSAELNAWNVSMPTLPVIASAVNSTTTVAIVAELLGVGVVSTFNFNVLRYVDPRCTPVGSAVSFASATSGCQLSSGTVIENCSSADGATFTATLSMSPLLGTSVIVQVGGRQCTSATVASTVLSAAGCLPPVGANESNALPVTVEIDGGLWWSSISVKFLDDKPGLLSITGCDDTYPSTGNCPFNTSTPMVITGVRLPPTVSVYFDMGSMWPNPHCSVTSSNSTHIMCTLSGGVGQSGVVKVINANGDVIAAKNVQHLSLSFEALKESECGRTSSGSCDNHGTCNPQTGRCECHASTSTGFWFGTACDSCQAMYANSTDCKLRCPGVGSPCSNHGACANGVCVSCDALFTGSDCSTRCPGATDACNGHGTCTSSGTCVNCTGNFAGAECNVCLPTHVGADCDLPCPVDGLSRVCGAKGQCVADLATATAKCVCTSGFCGAACDVTVCTACPSGRFGSSCQFECPGGAAMPCSGRGNCSEGQYGSGLCTCAVGSYGVQCEKECPRAAVSGVSCNGAAAGSCSAEANGCVCTATYAGAACDTECPGTDSNGTVCSGHGTCDAGANGTGTCTCSFGWAGADCASPCPGGASTPCGGHGACHPNVTCSCTSNANGGYWAGSACSVCQSGWAGVGCNVACPVGRATGDDLIGGSGLVCGGHGTCLSSGQCSCTSTQEDGYWGGTACDTCNPRFFGATCASLCPGSECSVCSGHGTCNPSTGVCTCMTGSAVTGSWGAAGCDACATGFYGPLCTKQCPDCANGACNSGTLGDGQCKCNAGWRADSAGRCTQCLAGHYGATCTACTTAPNGQICSGNGQCNDGASANGACVCSEGFAGPHCESSCPVVNFKGCAGHGTCTVAGCACAAGFVGADCSNCAASLFGPSCNNTCTVCAHGGTCRSGISGDGGCQCPDAFRGTTCDVPCPLSNGLACGGHGTCVVDSLTNVASCVCYANVTHGFFVGSSCSTCSPAYESTACKTPCPIHNGNVCNGRGTCFEGHCLECGPLVNDSVSYVCGNACNLFGAASCLNFVNSCPAGKWGSGCVNTCPGATDATGAGACNSIGVCNADVGTCICPTNATGSACEHVCKVAAIDGRPTLCGNGKCIGLDTCNCSSGYWGPTCTDACPGGIDSPCSGTGSCHSVSGQCDCPLGLAGVACELTCPGGRATPCSGHGRCRADASCDCDASDANGHFSGETCSVCVPGYGGGDCRTKCSANSETSGMVCSCFPSYAGTACTERCPIDSESGVVCAGHGLCFDGPAGNGTCGCEANYFGAACAVHCDAAVECRAKRGLSNARCTATGLCECERSTIAGYWTGAKCDECVPGYWGPLCNLLCQCNDHGTCDRDSGMCLCFADSVQGFWGGSVCEVCLTGYIGSRCQSKNIETSTNAALSIQTTASMPTSSQIASVGLHRFVDIDANMTYFYGGGSVIGSWREASGEATPTYLGQYTVPASLSGCDIIAMWADTTSSRIIGLAISATDGSLHELRIPRLRTAWVGGTLPGVTVAALSRFVAAMETFTDARPVEKTEDATALNGRALQQLSGTPAPATAVLCAGRDIARGVTAIVTGSRQVQIRRGVNLQVVSLGSVALDAVSVCSVDEGFVVLAGIKASRWAVVVVEIPGGSPVDPLPSTIAAFSIASTSLADNSVKATVTSATIAIECGVSPASSSATVAAFLVCGLRTTSEVIALRAEIPTAAARSVSASSELLSVVACAVPLQDTAADSKVTAIAFDTVASQHQTLVVLQQTGRAAVMHRLHLTTCIVTGIFTFGRVGGEYEVVQGIFVDSNVREMTAVITVAGRTEFRSLNLFGVREMSPAILDAAGGTPVRVSGEGFLALGNQTMCLFHGTSTNATLISDTEVLCASPQVTAAPATSGCAVFKLDVAFGTRKTSASNIEYQQIGSVTAHLATSGAKNVPFAQAESTATVTLHGTGFYPSPWAKCRLHMTTRTSHILLGNVTVLSSTKATCGIPAGLVPTVPPTVIEYSHDGVYFGSFEGQTAPFALVGVAADIAVQSPISGATFRSGTSAALPIVTVLVVDAHKNALHHLDTPTTARTAKVAVKRGSLFAASPFAWTPDSVTEETISDGAAVFRNLRLIRPTIGEVSLVVDVGAWRAVVPLVVVVGPPSNVVLISGPFARGNTAMPSSATSSWLVGTTQERLLPAAELVVTDAAGNEVSDAAELPPSLLARWTSATFPTGTGGTPVNVLQRRVATQTSSRYTFNDIKMRGVFGGTYTLTFEGSGVENLVVQIPVESCNNRTEYGKTGTPLCYQCPALGICDGGTEVLPQPGAWRSRLESYEIYSCFPPHSAGSCDDAGSCKNGYLGARCSQCEEGYGKVGLNCVECNDDILNWAMLALIALVVCGIMYAIVYLTVKQAQRALRGQVVRKDMIAIAYKMALNHVQIAAICVLANDNAGDVLDSFFGSGQKAATVTVDLSFISCTLTPTYRSKLVFMSAAPPVLIIVLAVVRAIQMIIHRGPERVDVRPEAGIEGPTRNVIADEKAKLYEQRPAAMVEIEEADMSTRIARNRQSILFDGVAADSMSPRPFDSARDSTATDIAGALLVDDSAIFGSRPRPSPLEEVMGGPEGSGGITGESSGGTPALVGMSSQPTFDAMGELQHSPLLTFGQASGEQSKQASPQLTGRRVRGLRESNDGAFVISGRPTPNATPREPGLERGKLFQGHQSMSLVDRVNSGSDGSPPEPPNKIYYGQPLPSQSLTFNDPIGSGDDEVVAAQFNSESPRKSNFSQPGAARLYTDQSLTFIDAVSEGDDAGDSKRPSRRNSAGGNQKSRSSSRSPAVSARRKSDGKARRSRRNRRLSTNFELARMREENKLRERPAVVEWVEFVAVAAVVVLFLLYPTILETAAQIFRCETIDYGSDGTRSLLIADRAVDCDGSEYQSLLGIALPVLIAYGVGLPVAVVLFVYGFRYATLKGNMAGAIQLFGYVTGGYRRDRWWWETVIFARKFVLSIGAVLFTDNRLRTYFMMWTLGVSVVGAAVLQSYENFLLSVLEALSLSTIAATVNVLLLYDYYNESSDPGQFWAVTASVVVMNVVMMLGLLIILATALRRKLEELVQDDPIGKAWIRNTFLRVPLPALNFFVNSARRKVKDARQQSVQIHRRMVIVDSLADAAELLPRTPRGLATAVKMYRKLQQDWMLRFDLYDLGPDVLISLYEHESTMLDCFMNEEEATSDPAKPARKELLKQRSMVLNAYFKTLPIDDEADQAELVNVDPSFDADAARLSILDDGNANRVQHGMMHRVRMR